MKEKVSLILDESNMISITQFLIGKIMLVQNNSLLLIINRNMIRINDKIFQTKIGIDNSKRISSLIFYFLQDNYVFYFDLCVKYLLYK